MCGRYVPARQAAIEREWQVKKGIPEFPLRWNVAPGAIIPVLRLDPASGELEVVAARWGLIPHWWKGEKPPNGTFNARLEEASGKPMWRDALRRTRCLVPAQGWYEWRKRERRAPGDGAPKAYKQPYFVHRTDDGPIAFAGLAAAWRAPGASEWVLSCAILTVDAPGALAELHERMPAALARRSQGDWLATELKDGAAATELARSAVSVEGLEYYAVSTRVNSAVAEGPELLEPQIGDQ